MGYIRINLLLLLLFKRIVKFDGFNRTVKLSVAKI